MTIDRSERERKEWRAFLARNEAEERRTPRLHTRCPVCNAPHYGTRDQRCSHR